MRNKNSGQSLTEALFVVVFTTIIMFAFLQVCIMIVDDMTANEAAFAAMRSAAVTDRSKKDEEVKNRVNTYMSLYYPFLLINRLTDSRVVNVVNGGSFVFSNKKDVGDYFIRHRRSGENDDGEEDESAAGQEDGEALNESVTIYKNKFRVQYKDYSNRNIEAHTTKIYYYTRVMFGFLVAQSNSNARRKKAKDYATIKADRLLGRSGNRRYQSARSRMVLSPDADFYDKAYPGAEKFKNYGLSTLLN